MTDLICAECKFFDPMGPEKPPVQGECRIRAPSLVGASGEAVWPIVAHDDWCNESEKKMTHEDYMAEYQATCSHMWHDFRDPRGGRRKVCKKCALELELP